MMECNHRFKNELFLTFSMDNNIMDNNIFCGECYIHFGRVVNKPIFHLGKDTKKGLIELNESKEMYLEEFQSRFINCEIITVKDKYKLLSKSDEDHFKLISEVNQDIKKSENIDQHVIINNQINKITDLETEVKRLEKIVIGLSERLVNETKIH